MSFLIFMLILAFHQLLPTYAGEAEKVGPGRTEKGFFLGLLLDCKAAARWGRVR